MDDEELKAQKLCMYVSTYRKDYIKRKFKRVEPIPAIQEFKDPINRAFENYLETDKGEYKPPVEEADVYLEKLKEKDKKLGDRYFKTPLDHKIINWEKIMEDKSTYQGDYCDIEEDMRKALDLKHRKARGLPEGWVLPITTQQYDYRNPIIIAPSGLERVKKIPPRNNIVQDEKLNEIVKLSKIDSEYNTVIGTLGEFIVKNEMHGETYKVE